MRARTHLLALLALACAHCAPPDPYALTIAGPTTPFHGPATITATPQPADGTVAVRFSVDGEVRAEVDAAPYTATLDLAQAWGGIRHVTAVAERADGATAEASIDLTYDPIGPFVTVLAPMGTPRVRPEGGAIDVAFLASDPSGLAAGAVQVEGDAPLSLPLPALALSVPISPAEELPAVRAISWWIDDAAGNRTEGKLPFIQTHERFRTLTTTPNTTIRLPGERLAVLSETRLFTYEADGQVAWSFDPEGNPFLRASPAKDGDLFVARARPDAPHAISSVRRLHADGSAVWEWSVGPDRTASDMAYVAGSDSLLVLHQTDDPTSERVSLVAPTGGSAPVTDLGLYGTILASPGEASPGGFAIGSPVDGGTTHYDIYDASGALAWGCDMRNGTTSLATRDALVGFADTPQGVRMVLRGPAGIVADLGAVTTPEITPDGDLLFTSVQPDGSGTATRMHPDGSIAWQTQMAEPIRLLFAGRDHVALGAGSAVRVVGAAGAAVDWVPAPEGVGLFPSGTGGATVSPSGAFYVYGVIDGAAVRVFRADATGKTLWHETIHEEGATITTPIGLDDERLILSVALPPGPTAVVHALEP
ncbi:MAG: hypothetical protein QM820_06545 [Minicystis sp.]